MEVEPAIERKISALAPGEHICCLVSNTWQLRETLVHYLLGGLNAGQQVIFAYHNHTPEMIVEWLEAEGAGARASVDTGRLMLCPAGEVYGPPNTRCSASPADWLRARAREAALAGYSDLRFAIDMGFASQVKLGSPEMNSLLTCETQLNEAGLLAGCTVMCLYERQNFDPQVLIEVVTAHPVIAEGPFVYRNSSYVPGAYLSLQRGQEQLDRMLHAITSRQQTEWQINQVWSGLAERVDLQMAALARDNERLSSKVQQQQGIETALAESYAALRETENRYRTIFNAATEAIIIHDLEGRLLEVNSIACQRLGYTQGELIGKTADILDVPDLAGQAAVRTALINQYGSISYETVHQTRAGDMIPVEVNARLIEYEGRAVVLNIARDITDRKHAELALVNANEALASANEALAESYAALRESEQKFRSLAESSPDGIALVDENGRIVEFNAANETIFGLPAPRVLGKKLDRLAISLLPAANNRKDLRRSLSAAIKEALRSGESGWLGKVHEKAMALPSGQRRFIQTTAFPIQTERGYMVGLITRDVTGHRQAELELEQYREGLEVMVAQRTEQLQHEIAERQQAEQNLEVMLREIHHRVKNNLNVIIALIDLQKEGQADVQVLQVFKELQARAYTMALVHESLYRSPNLVKVNFSGYLNTLTAYLQSMYGPVDQGLQVRIAVEAENVDLKIETAIPCGLVVNELVTNALKYAFKDGRFKAMIEAGDQPQITVRLELDGENENGFILSVCDNGVGLPDGFEWQSATTLGLQLVQVLARQLGGRITLNSSSGAAWRLAFTERK